MHIAKLLKVLMRLGFFWWVFSTIGVVPQQDQVMEVRTAFGAKVCSMVQLLNKHQAHRASKYAAMLALAGMDPLESNK